MMLIPPAVNLGTTDASITKDKYFSSTGIYTTNPSSAQTTISELSQHNSGNRSLYQSPSVESRMFLNAPKMQSDLPGFPMHAAAAVATGHPGSFPLASPASYAAGAATVPSHGIVPNHYGSPAIDPSSYYSSLGSGYDMKSGDMWNGGYSQPAHTYYQYEPGFAPQYPYDRCYPMDMNDGVRRKNATRESTNTLKAWLQEHKKNPYPTKGEKIMLAIITKMTLTQVSTWFANARRRLKKENKMTWIPKNRANEPGSGTEDRGASDDKDSDEKSDDEDCKSDKEDNDRSPESKPDADLDTDSSCQFSQKNQSTATYNQSRNSIEPLNQEITEGHEIEPPQEYGRIMNRVGCDNQSMLGTSNANNSLSEKLHSANIVQNAVGMKYETVPEGYNRPIWSPIDSHSHKNSLTAVRPYQSVYGTDYHCQDGYQQDPEGHRHPSAHLQSYPVNYELSSLPHLSMSHNSQEGHNHSASSHIGLKIFSSMSRDPGSKHIQVSNENEHAQDSCRRTTEYPYISPMTNLRNYVDGVFQSSPQQVPAPMCDKTTIGQEKSPNSTRERVVSPASGPQYRQSIDQRYLHQRQMQSGTIPSSHQALNNILHRSRNAPYSSYFGENVNCYPPHSLADSSHQHCNSAYYSHHSNAVSTGPLSEEQISTDTVRPSNSSEQFITSQQQQQQHQQHQHCQSSPSQCRQSTTSNVTDCSSSTCIRFYDGSADNSNMPSAITAVPPPPYSKQCKYAESNPQAYLSTQSRALSHRQSYDGLNPDSNQSSSSHSPRGLQSAGPSVQARDGAAYMSVVASDEEEAQKIPSSDAMNDKISR